MSSTNEPSTTPTIAGSASKVQPNGNIVMLFLAFWAFLINFWAWTLIGPLAPTYSDRLDLSAPETSLLVAIPVLVGALGRMPVGVWTDRYGGRVMFTVISLLTIVPVVFLALFDSYPALLVGGFFLGIGGTAFAVGIPYVNAWYPPARRGFALGLYGMGMGGSALSAFFTPRLADSIGRTETHLLIAAALAGTAIVTFLFARNSPSWSANTAPAMPRFTAAAKLPVTWQLSAIYAIVFGGFVAFGAYLPTLLKTAYELDQTGAGTRTAGFALAAVIARPIGGKLSDMYHPRTVLMASLGITGILAIVAAFLPSLELPAGTTFILLAIALGLGTGATFAYVALLTDPARVGTVTGIVGAAGGLGGYFPPLVMGVVYGTTSSFAIGFMLLSDVAFAALIFVWVYFERQERRMSSTEVKELERQSAA